MASLRRSGVRLSSLGKSNGDLKMVISQLKTVRENYVAYTKAQVDRFFVRKRISPTWKFETLSIMFESIVCRKKPWMTWPNGRLKKTTGPFRTRWRGSTISMFTGSRHKGQSWNLSNAKLERKLNKCWFAFREFADCFDDFRQNFKMILEGEQGVESAKSDYEACEHREHKLAKDLKKLSKKAGNCPKAIHQSIFVHLLCKHQLSPRLLVDGQKLKAKN